ncbi:helix-turn-helix domain-containing protein [Chryseobacterium sp. GP-SGM7]|uniref:helix-turn-helix domain-containing protein n=1 Tax=Chryseobacterium sp. GP-SGM7 TaxID=3411323 RepID=UPI003B93A22C
MTELRPNYKKIFEDIVEKKCPDRLQEFNHYFRKKSFTIMDVIDLNNKIFALKDRDTIIFNQKHKSYDRETILKILAYQEKEKLNNIQLANHFNLSRNTVGKWRKLYMENVGK